VYLEWQVRRRVAELEGQMLKRLRLGGGQLERERQVVHALIEG
jgi:hypothetical protein